VGVIAMPAATSEASRPKISPRFLPVIDRVLATGLKFGNAGKHAAINKVLQLVPEWRRGDCWQRIRHLQKTLSVPNRQLQVDPANSATQAQLAHPSRTSWRRWSAEEDLKLLDWAGYEPVDKISQRLNRSIRAIRFRLCALGMSGKVTDGWSLRELRKLLRVSPAKLKQFIGGGMLRVRDPRVTARSLAVLCQRNATSLDRAAVERVATLTATKKKAYTWERAAEFLGVDLKQVQSWISMGQLKVRDTFVTDRSFEEFCKKYASETNLTLIDPATRKWLIQEYGLSAGQPIDGNVPRAQKHALTVRTCECGRSIAGNVYFRHRKSCKVAARQSVPAPVYEFNPAGKTVGGSTKESALPRHS
jgi:hypothetical protein